GLGWTTAEASRGEIARSADAVGATWTVVDCCGVYVGGTLLRRAVQRLENFEVERGLELLEEHRQRGAHDPRADQDDIPFRGETISDHAVSPTSANNAAGR